MMLLVRPDTRFQNMESKIDTLADQLSGSALMRKKGHSKEKNLLSRSSPTVDRLIGIITTKRAHIVERPVTELPDVRTITAVTRNVRTV